MNIFRALTCFAVCLLQLNCKGEHKYELEDLLDMKDVSSPAALPKLEKILQKDDDRSIFPSAAAQALFLMNTKEARAVLDKYLVYPHYDFEASIRYATYWNAMPRKQIDDFIKTYHLRSQAKDVTIAVAAKPLKKIGSFHFTVTLTNVSAKPLRLYKRYVYLGDCLLILDGADSVMPSDCTVKYKLRMRTPEETYVEVQPRKTYEFAFDAKPTKYANNPIRNDDNKSGVCLNCGDYDHKLTNPGIYTVYAIYENRNYAKPPYANIWVGRLVSAPIKIAIPSFAAAEAP